MQLRYTCAALLGFWSLADAAPSVKRDLLQPAEKGLRWRSRAQKRSPLTIVQEVSETNIIVVNENLGQLAAQQQIIEQEFAALVQAQVALVTQLEDIKNNIRINHFKARFSQVNTVIVTVQTLVDSRSNAASNRYLIKQLLADNGKPESAVVVMVSEAATMTIAAASQPVVINGASAASTPTAAPEIANFDASAPFGQLNQSLILPAGAQAPKIDQIFADPASIILPNQNSIFVEDSNTFLSDCAQSSAFFQLQAAQVFGSFEQLAAAQSGAVIIGDVTIINVDDNNNDNNKDDDNKDDTAPTPNNVEDEICFPETNDIDPLLTSLLKKKKDDKDNDDAAKASASASADAAASSAAEAAASATADVTAAPAVTSAPEAVPAEAAPAVTSAPEAVPAEAAPAVTSAPEAVPAEAAPAVTSAPEAVPAEAAPAEPAAAPQGFVTIVPPAAAV